MDGMDALILALPFLLFAFVGALVYTIVQIEARRDAQAEEAGPPAERSSDDDPEIHGGDR